jgi:hypothetical protein
VPCYITWRRLLPVRLFRLSLHPHTAEQQQPARICAERLQCRIDGGHPHEGPLFVESAFQPGERLVEIAETSSRS